MFTTSFPRHPKFHRALRGLRNFRFPAISKNAIHEQHSEKRCSNDSKSRKRFISTQRWIDPHHTCHTAPPPQRYAETMDRCARAKEIRVHHRLRNDFGTGRVSFHHVPTFPKQREATITRVRTFLFCLKEGRNIFFFPFFLSFFLFPWIHSNEPRAQLKRYTWTVGKIF